MTFSIYWQIETKENLFLHLTEKLKMEENYYQKNKNTPKKKRVAATMSWMEDVDNEDKDRRKDDITGSEK